MKRIILALCMVMAMTATSIDAHAAGFGIYEWSARGNALGGAMVGRADDASAIAYNPAGITQIEGAQVMAGFSSISPSATIEAGGEEYDGESETWLPPHFYYTQQLNDKLWAGIGGFSRFGLASEWDEDWNGRYNLTAAWVKSFSVNPVLSYKLSDKFSVSAGPEIMWFEFTQKKNVDPSNGAAPSLNNDIQAKVKGDSYGVGATLALHYKATDDLRFGLTYRSQIEQNLEGESSFTKRNPALLPATYFNDTDVKGTIVLPDQVFFGVVYNFTDRLSAEAGLNWTRWSNYSSLTIKYDDPIYGTVDSTTSKKNWKDTWRYQLGLEYKATDWMDLRAGYIYDESPIDGDYADYMVPANDRQLFSGGVGFHWDVWTVDTSYTYLWMKGRNYNDSAANNPKSGVLPGVSKDGNAHILGLTVGYKF